MLSNLVQPVGKDGLEVSAEKLGRTVETSGCNGEETLWRKKSCDSVMGGR